MKKIILLLFIATYFFSYSQTNTKIQANPKYPELFKLVPLISEEDPEWVKLMYSDKPNLRDITKAFRKFYNQNVYTKTTHTQNFKHLNNQIKLNNYVLDNGDIYIPSVEEVEVRETTILQKNLLTKSNSSNWTPIGPFETFSKTTGTYRSSQLNVYTFDQSQSNPNILFAGAETGPLFKSTDKGLSWFAIAEDIDLKAGGAIEIDPANENIVFVSDGRNKLWKTTDGGTNWSLIQTINNLRITDISINGQVIITAGTFGLQRSSDGGASWTTISSDKCWDLELKTDNPNIVFVAKSNYSANRTEIWKSTDNGLTFTPKTTGWFQPLTGTALSNGGARIGVSDADPNRVYVVLLGNENDSNDDANFIGIYRSNDAGETWSTPYDGNNDGSPDNEPGGPYGPDHWCFSTFNPNENGGYNQGYYNLALDVSDTDADKFLVGFLSLFKSEDGGSSYTEWGGYRCNNCGDGYRHPDIQEIEMNGNDVWVCTDGGVAYYDNNLDYIESRINNLTGVNFWEVDQGWNEDVIVGGRYHNGNTGYYKNYGTGKFLALGGGESATGYVNKAINKEVHFDDIQDVILPTSLTGEVKSTSNYQYYPNQHYYLDSKSEVVTDPTYWNHLYLGKDNNLWKSENGGSSFDLLKAFGTDETDILKGIEISRKNTSVIYVVQEISGGDILWKSIDKGVSWNEVTLPPVNNRILISISESDENVLYLSFMTNNSEKIYKTEDGGDSWTNLTTSILNGERIFYIKTQAGTPNGVYLATNYNVFYKNDTMANWTPFVDGLPYHRSPLKLMPFYKESKIRYALSNRGIYESDMHDDFLPIAQPMVANKAQYCANRGVQFEDYSILNHNGATWTWDFPGAISVSDNNARNPLVYYDSPGTYDVSLTITDANGYTDSKTISEMIQIFDSQCAPEPTPQMALACQTSSQYASNDLINLTGVTEFSFSAWVKPDSIQVDYSGIFSLGGGNGDNKNVLNFRGGNNTLGFHWNGGYWGWDSGLKVPADEWSFVGITVENNRVTLFVNEDTVGINISLNPYDIDRIIIGSYYEWSSRTYKGLIDEATFWKKALTVNEMRLSRHLSKMDISDPDLMAYYQFNHNNTNKVFDKKNANDLKLIGNASLVNSTAPFGDGTSEMQQITNSGTYNFNTPKVSLDFIGTETPNGDVVVTNINNNPNNLPEGASYTNQYWVINNYGINETFDYINTLTFENAGDLTDIGNAVYYLHKRPSNSDSLTHWQENVSSQQYDETNDAITFLGDYINNFSQFYITKSIIDSNLISINEVEENLNVNVYPNPLINGNSLNIVANKEVLKFTLFDVNGKEIEKFSIENMQSVQIKELPSGIYYYVIETKEKMYSNKILIQ